MGYVARLLVCIVFLLAGAYFCDLVFRTGDLVYGVYMLFFSVMCLLGLSDVEKWSL